MISKGKCCRNQDSHLEPCKERLSLLDSTWEWVNFAKVEENL